MTTGDGELLLAEVLYRTAMHAAGDFMPFRDLNEDVQNRWRERAKIFMAHYARTINEQKSDEQIREEMVAIAREALKTKNRF